MNVEVANESTSRASSLYTNDAGSLPDTTTIAAGEPINDEQLKRAVSFSSDPVFTAHFKQKSTKTDDTDDADDDTDDADNDSNNTDNTVVTNVKSVKSASSSKGASGANQIPATGDTLAGTVVFFLCASVASALTALVTLFSRRKHMGLHAR